MTKSIAASLYKEALYRMKSLLKTGFTTWAPVIGFVLLASLGGPPVPAEPELLSDVTFARIINPGMSHGPQIAAPEPQPSPAQEIQPSPSPTVHRHRALNLGGLRACIRRAETRGWADPYKAVSKSGEYRGAYQADRGFWLTYGGDPSYAGTPDDPSTWHWEDAPHQMQDDVATAGYRDRKLAPWPPAQHC